MPVFEQGYRRYEGELSRGSPILRGEPAGIPFKGDVRANLDWSPEIGAEGELFASVVLDASTATGGGMRFVPGSGRISGDGMHRSNLIQIAYERTLAGNPTALVDHLDLVLLSGRMSQAMRGEVTRLIQDTPFGTDGTDRVLEAIFLVVSSPEYAVQE